MKWLFVFVLAINVTWAKEYFTINGFVTDQASGEPLALANVISIKTKVGTNTNTFGYYSLIVEADSIDLEFSYIGYQSKSIKVFVDRNIRLDIGLVVQALDEVTIFANDDNSASIIGTNKLNNQLISKTATLLAESDVIKSLQLFPGVQGGNEGFATLSVRGGSHDQNLLLLDGIPIYNASHLFGFLSTFNPDIVKDVLFIKGDIPARYGERLSSVVDISTKEGNAKKLKGSFSLSPITNQLSLEGPVIKQKSSFIVSTRRTWLDAIINLVSPDNPIKYNFGDFNVKYNHNIDAKNKLYAGLNTSQDKFFSDMNIANSSYHFRWGSSAYYLRWNKIFNTRLFGSFFIYASDFKFSQSFTSKEHGRVQRRTFKSAINDNSLNLNFDYSAASRHYLRFGAQVSYLTFRPDIVEAIGFDVNENSFAPGRQYNGANVNIYVEDEVKLSESLTVNLGGRQSLYYMENKSFAFFQPRISATQLLFSSLSMKASFTRMSQYLHLLTNTSISFPVDLWVPSTSTTKPEVGTQYSLGIQKRISVCKLDISLDGYYKTMNNLIEYKDGASYLFGSQNDWEEKINYGKGTSYGIELFIERSMERLSGWLSYTLSRSERLFEEINNGKPFPYKFDRRHNLSLFTSYNITKNQSLSAVFVLTSGSRITLPEGKYQTFRPPFYENTTRYKGGGHEDDFSSNQIISERNNYQLPLYHRLDLNYQTTKVTKRKNRRTWIFSIYNVYNRKNPFVLSENMGRIKNFTLFPFIPSVGYKLQF
jgi:Outer membrane receptor for ferrienterochelin and colicins